MNRMWMILLLPALALANAGGPPNGVTGAPGQNNCTQCHGGNAVNSGNGLFTITGPETYVPGQSYPITVTLQDPGQSRWGFEFTPLNKGTLQITDATHTQSGSASGNSYVKHNSAGTFDNTADGPVSWTFNWTAPSGDEGPVTFYAAGNAANSNNSNNGDFIYTTSFTTQAATSMPEASARGFALLEVFPNPFNPDTRLSFQLDQPGDVSLDVFDLGGRLMGHVAQGWHSAGLHTTRWNGLTLQQRPAPAGVYLARLESGGQVTVTRMLLVK